MIIMRNLLEKMFAGWLVVVLMSGCLLGWGDEACGAVPGGTAPGAEAAEMVVFRTKGPPVTLQQAVDVVKKFIRIPEEYTYFQPELNDGDKQGVFWELRWENDESGGISARVNAETGELWSFNKWEPSPPATARYGIPKLDRSNAQLMAEIFLRRVIPDYINDLSKTPEAVDPVPSLGLWEGAPPAYILKFVRLVNGVPFPEDNATVEVDAGTGEIRNYSLIWSRGLKFPEARNIIGADQARDIWRESARVQLTYCRTGESGRNARVQLVYVSGSRPLMIDAGSGEVLKPGEAADYGQFEMVMSGGGERMKTYLNMALLTPAEQADLVTREGLVSQEKALEIVRTWIGIPQGYKLVTANLQQEYITRQLDWEFSWVSEAGEATLNVRLDARRGVITGYRLYDPGGRLSPGSRCDEARAREMAAQFLARVAGGHGSEIGELRVIPGPPLSPVDEGGVPVTGQEQPGPISYGFVAERLVNGIPFHGDGAMILVDALRGKVTGYRFNWCDVEIPEARGVISREQAENVFLANSALELCYRREFLRQPQDPDEERPVRLVYTLNERKSPVFVDPFTGIGLESDLQPVAGTSQAVFSDLAGHPAAEAVNMLVRARIIPVAAPSFHPEGTLSQGDFLTWLLRASGWRPWYANSLGREFENGYREALRLGILKPGEPYLPQEPLSKLTLARLTVRALGLEMAARTAGARPLPLTVQEQVPVNEQGYLALAGMLGIVNINEKGFDPGAKFTRAEGALALYRLLK